jgi:ribose 5-phosphate isomerase A
MMVPKAQVALAGAVLLPPCQHLLAVRRRGACSRRLAMPARAAADVKLSQDELKKQAAWKAVDYVKSGMKLGLGTGSTAAFAVDRIGQLLKEGKLTDIVGVPTSIRTYEQALGVWPTALIDAPCLLQHPDLHEHGQMHFK